MAPRRHGVHATSWVQAFTGERAEIELVEPPAVTEANPFVTRIATTSRSAASTFVRQIEVWADSGRIDFRLIADWQEGNAFLKLGFRPTLTSPRVRAAVAHGAVDVADPSREFCAHDYVRLDSPEGGLALLDDGAYGCDIAEGRLGLSCIRTVRDMDPAMAQGEHELRYSLVPLRAGAPESEVLKHVGNFDHQAVVAFEPAHPGGIKTWGRFDNSQALPPARSFCRVQTDDPRAGRAVLCAFKMLEEDWQPLSFVVRIREVDGREQDCLIELPTPVSRAVLADHLERPSNRSLPCQGNAISLHLRPFEIATALVYV